MAYLDLFNVLLEKHGILFMAQCQSRHGNEPGFILGVGAVNQMQDMSHGITNDLAFGPAK